MTPPNPSDLLEVPFDLYEALKREKRMVRLVVHARTQCERQGRAWYENPYDKMMWKLIGHPQFWQTRFPDVRRETAEGEVRYDVSPRASYSKNHIVYTGQTRQPVNPLLRRFVVSGNLRTGELTEWFVVGTKPVGSVYEPLSPWGEELLLSNRPLNVVPSVAVDRPLTGNLLEDSFLEEEAAEAQAAIETNRPRLISTTQGGWFVPGQGAPAESLAEISEVDIGLQRFYRRFGGFVAYFDYEVTPVQPVTLQLASG